MLMLGDHIYSTDADDSCARQVINVYEQVNKSVISLDVLPGEIIHKAGCITGNWIELNSILSIAQICEKPDLEYARKHLRVAGMADDQFLCVFGIYILTPKIFEYLEEHISNNIRERGEFQLTSCLDRLREDEGMTGYAVNGQTFDIGLPDAYRQTMIDFRL